MIRTVGDLLQELIAREVSILDAENVTHPGTIGDMYEGLTAHVLRTALPFENVTVTTGFAEGTDGIRSRQLDCMVVIGEGRPIPYTSAHVYPVQNVVAIVEVKKSLNASDIKDAYELLRDAANLELRGISIPHRTVRKTFQSITHKVLADSPLAMPEPFNTIYRCLATEAVLPARIVLGYHGHKSMKGFRVAIATDIEKRVGTSGTGPVSLPTLVMNDRFAVVKTDGLPYAQPMSGDKWPVLLSSSAKPVLVLLEVLWGRLTARLGEPPGLFGEDLGLEACTRFMDYALAPAANGWIVSDFRDFDPERYPNEPQAWEPARLTDEAFLLVQWLCTNETLDLAANEEPPGAPRPDVLAAVAELEQFGIAGRDPTNEMVVRLLTEELASAVTPDGFVAGENVSGRMSRWMLQQAKKNWKPAP